MSCQLKVIDNFKYLGHLISSKSGDNDDIMHQNAATICQNKSVIKLIQKCNTDVKLFLFKAYCMSLYGMATWHLYNVPVMQRFEAAYVQ